MTRRHKGQVLAEFALVAPLFFLLLFGIIEAGRFIYYYETLSSATREGARYAIVNGYRSFSPTGPERRGNAIQLDRRGGAGRRQGGPRFCNRNGWEPGERGSLLVVRGQPMCFQAILVSIPPLQRR